MFLERVIIILNQVVGPGQFIQNRQLWSKYQEEIHKIDNQTQHSVLTTMLLVKFM